MLRFTSSALLFVFLFTILIGCSKNPQGRKEIRGSVTLKGEPIESGSIFFESIGTQKERTSSGSTIRDGQYKIPTPKGLVPGEYAVRIVAVEILPLPSGADPMGTEPEQKDIVPPEFGSKSNQKITVTDSGKQVFDFKM